MNKNRIANFFPSLTRDFILFYRISVIGIFIAGSLFVKVSLDQKKDEIVEKIFLAAEEIDKSITFNVDYLKYQLYYATKQIEDSNASTSDKKMEKILSSFVSNINNQIDISITWNAFSWINKYNKVSVDGAAGIIKNPIDLSNRDYLKNTSKYPNKLAFGQPVTGALSGRLIIPVGMGVFSEGNDYLGTLVFGLDIERILTKINNIIGNETFGFVVLNGKEIAFTSSNFEEKKSSLDQDIIDQIQSGEKNLQEKKVINSQNLFSKASSFTVFKAIKNTPLSIVVFYDNDKSYEEILNTFLRQSFFVFLVIFACIILFQRIYRKIVKPTLQLSQLALKISKRDFSFRIEKPKGKEMINLFNTLTSLKDIMQHEEILLKRLEIVNFELSKANESKAEFLSKSSHDIKNYIFGILGLSRIILENKNKSQILQNEDLQMVKTISDQSEELLNFVEDLLDVKQTKTGEFSLEKITMCDIAALINRVVLLNRSLAINHKISLIINLEKDLPQLPCDVRRMKQILTNIISNAIKYSKPQTNVTIAAKYLTVEKKICIEIEDQGVGMSEVELQMLLSGQGKDIDKSEFKNVDSHGIGMSIVLRLIKLHHGIIEINSKKGLGTKVKLYFDVPEKLVQKNSQNNESILLVEDDLVSITISSNILQKAGYKVVVVSNGQEALEILDQENFDLILMDGEMPVMSGYDATKKIREGSFFKKFKNYKTIPIIAFMASSDQAVIKKALESGMSDHAEKSISKDQLLNKISKYL